jgi:hypothetical protein
MLKTQFVKSFYLCNSFLLITTSFSSIPLTPGTITILNEKKVIELSAPVNLGSKSGNFNSNDLYFSQKGKQSQLDKPQIKMSRTSMLYVRKYINKRSNCLVNVKKRSQVPFYIIDSVFTRYGLPVELKYLAVIESELKPSAVSHVGAKGPWQFMPETAHILGLKINHQCDERSNYYKSTIAAARYLKDLYALFDDWLLVLAAYNGGPKPVYRAIRESGSRNFWVLQGYLPAESREHVKKFIATHYYFEGRGSETTLTRAENAALKRKVNAFAKSLRAPKIFENVHPQSSEFLFVHKEKTQTGMYDLNLIFEPGNLIYGSSLQKMPTSNGQQESPEVKFDRLMKESEESLNNSRRII